MKRTAIFLTSIALVVGAAHAAPPQPVAKLGKVEGVVVVNQGERFTQARRGMTVYQGDRIFVMEGAVAELAYEPRCRLRLSSNSMLLVGRADECATGHVQVRSFGPHYAAAIGLDAPSVTDTEDEAAGTAAEGAGAEGAVAEAAAAGGGTAAAMAVPATLSGVVLYALIAAGGGAKGTPTESPVSAQ